MTEKIKKDSALIKEAEAKKVSFLLALAIGLRKKIFTFTNLNFCLAIFIASAGVYYLTGINDLTVKGFHLRELQYQTNYKNLEKKDLENKIMHYQSTEYLSEAMKKLSLVPVGSGLVYLENDIGAMAKR